ncbi:MAG TPA: response regulator, partial [Bacteroidia bacterium]|nr:response regulator [Bacteroidia bacterium]
MNETIKIKIFLVDDDQMYLKALENEFKKNENFEIITYTTGEECLKNLHLNPDVIILDYFLN